MAKLRTNYLGSGHIDFGHEDSFMFAHFGPEDQSLTKLSKGTLCDDACKLLKINTVWFQTRRLCVSLYINLCKSGDTCDGAIFGLSVILLIDLVEYY